MVNFCAVFGCSNRGGRFEGKSFYRIPAIITNQDDKTKKLSEKRRDSWLNNIGRRDMNKESLYQYRVCSDHFITGVPAKLYDETNPDWAPTINMGHQKLKHTPVKLAERYERNIERHLKKKQLVSEYVCEEDRFTNNTVMLLSNNSLEDCTVLSTIEEQDLKVNESANSDSRYSLCNSDTETCSVEIQTDITYAYIDRIEEEIQRLRLENEELKKCNDDFKFTQQSFSSNNDKVRYITGLPNYLVLLQLLTLLETSIVETRRSSLNKFQQLVLTLMKLRLNLPVMFLAYLFQISPSTVSKIFKDVVNIMYIRLKRLIHWPDREQLRKTMPMCFRRNFQSKVVVIIDCFEIFIERPTNLKARAMTWSSYKHNNTVKYLIGITPQGVISFISKGWGGRVSDKHLTENCGLLANLLPGDLVLADRGFDIADSVGTMCAELNIPAFTRGKNQLDPLDIEKTRKIANVRIHVERVIGNLRQKYTYLDGVVPIDHLLCPEGDVPMLDKEIAVACALININESVIPFD